jgi:hypothetical protein
MKELMNKEFYFIAVADMKKKLITITNGEFTIAQ